MNNQKRSKMRRFSALSIRTRLFLSFILLLIIPALLIGTFSYNSAKKELKETILSGASENVKLLDEFLSDQLDPKINDANYFSDLFNKDSYSSKEKGNTIKKLEQYAKLHPEATSIYIGTASGEMILYPNQDLPDDFDPRQRSWYQDAVSSNGKSITTDPYTDASTGDVLITVAQSVKDGSGVLAIDISLKELSEMASLIKIGEKGYPIILDTSGNYVVHPTQKSGDPATESWSKTIYRSDSGHISYDYNGTPKEMDFYTNELTGWKIVGTMNLAEIDDAARPILINTLVIIAIFILLGLTVSYFITRSISRPLKELVEITERVSEGDLTQFFKVKNNDEISQVGISFNKMILALKDLIQHVGEKSDQLASSSEELTASSEQNNHATEQVASAIQHVAAGTEKQKNMVRESTTVVTEMAEGIQTIMANSQTVAGTATEAALVVTSGVESIQQSVKQMQNISETVNDLGTVINTLGERSKEISQIIDVISDIAGQTNLLALNAAIEAARAGEHGKGFAVVAAEVRKLAEQSAKSTESIRHLITSIQSDTELAVGSMEKGASEVEKGITIVDSAGASFMQIQKFVDTVTTQIQEVSASIEQMSAGASQVVELVSEIDEITASTSAEGQEVSAATEEQLASMQEIAASAAALSFMAEELQESVKRFKI